MLNDDCTSQNTGSSSSSSDSTNHYRSTSGLSLETSTSALVGTSPKSLCSSIMKVMEGNAELLNDGDFKKGVSGTTQPVVPIGVSTIQDDRVASSESSRASGSGIPTFSSPFFPRAPSGSGNSATHDKAAASSGVAFLAPPFASTSGNNHLGIKATNSDPTSSSNIPIQPLGHHHSTQPAQGNNNHMSSLHGTPSQVVPTEVLKPSPVRTTASSILAPKIGHALETSSHSTSSNGSSSSSASALAGTASINNNNRIFPPPPPPLGFGTTSAMNSNSLQPSVSGFPMLPASLTTPFPPSSMSSSLQTQTSMMFNVQQPFPVQNSLIKSSSSVETTSQSKGNSLKIDTTRNSKKIQEQYESEKDCSDDDDDGDSSHDDDGGDYSDQESASSRSSRQKHHSGGHNSQEDEEPTRKKKEDPTAQKIQPGSRLNSPHQSQKTFVGGSNSNMLGISPFPPSNATNKTFLGTTPKKAAGGSVTGSATTMTTTTSTTPPPLSHHSSALNLAVATQLQPITTKSTEAPSKKKRKVQVNNNTTNAQQPNLVASSKTSYPTADPLNSSSNNTISGSNIPFPIAHSPMNSFLPFPPPRNAVDTTPTLTNSNNISSPSTPSSTMNQVPTHHPNSSSMFVTHATATTASLSLAPSLAPSTSIVHSAQSNNNSYTFSTSNASTNNTPNSIAIPPPPSLPPPPFTITASSPIMITSSPDQKSHNRTLVDSPTIIGPEKKAKASPLGSTQISFKLWLKTLDTLSISKLKLVQEKVNRLLKEKENNEPLASTSVAVDLKQEEVPEISKDHDTPQEYTPNSQDSLITATEGVFEENEAAALLSRGGMSSIDTLLSVALSDYTSQKEDNSSSRSTKKFSIVSPPSPFLPPFPSSKSSTMKMVTKSLTSDDDSDAGFSVESETLQIEGRQVEPFVREYKGHGFLYPGRRGLKSQQVKAPLCTFPGMRNTILDTDKGGDSPTFVEGEDIVNPVIDLEHHLEFYIPDKDMTLYNNVRAYGLSLLKRVDRNCYIEESKILLARKPTIQSKSSSYSFENEYSLSIVAHEEKEYPSADYSILLIETRGKKRNVNVSEEDKISRYCEISHDYINKQTKFRIGFRICKAQKKKHTKGIYLLRLVAFLRDPAVGDASSPTSSPSLFESASPDFGIKKVLEESDMFKIVSRRSVVERTRMNKRKKSSNDEEDESPSSNQ
ncbi:hypothetical protein C9374_001048 [Naegleria lovaniensis]|uniref:Uncharacterized protein n=1 Tax=Naegleria lovaniensis TaxID=51637 RepID=A0AA88GYX9_NAELO|nr:uncharacterized protein C9374_001048 [Naegleria lovaniensis]KAG2388198.1 hypothetical protein C9374_001048 [Naegleria lovaniensis]